MPILKFVWRDGQLVAAANQSDTDADAARVCRACREDGSLAQAFFGRDDLWPDEFARAETSAEYIVLIFDAEDRPLGFYGLNGFEGLTARLHICPAAAARPHLSALSRAVLAWCRSLGLAAVIGVTPARYQGVAGYAREAGGEELGRVPGFFYLSRLKRHVDGLVFVFKL